MKNFFVFILRLFLFVIAVVPLFNVLAYLFLALTVKKWLYAISSIVIFFVCVMSADSMSGEEIHTEEIIFLCSWLFSVFFCYRLFFSTINRKSSREEFTSDSERKKSESPEKFAEAKAHLTEANNNLTEIKNEFKSVKIDQEENKETQELDLIDKEQFKSDEIDAEILQRERKMIEELEHVLMENDNEELNSIQIDQEMIVQSQKETEELEEPLEENNESKIDLNLADSGELWSLDGITVVQSKYIIREREENGPYSSLEDFFERNSIPKKNQDLMASKLTVFKSSLKG